MIKLYVNPNNSLLPFGLLNIPLKAFLISVGQVQKIPVDSARKPISSYLLVHAAFAALKSQAVFLPYPVLPLVYRTPLCYGDEERGRFSDIQTRSLEWLHLHRHSTMSGHHHPSRGSVIGRITRGKLKKAWEKSNAATFKDYSAAIYYIFVLDPDTGYYLLNSLKKLKRAREPLTLMLNLLFLISLCHPKLLKTLSQWFPSKLPVKCLCVNEAFLWRI